MSITSQRLKCSACGRSTSSVKDSRFEKTGICSTCNAAHGPDAEALAVALAKTLGEALLRGAETGDVEAGKLFRESIVRRILASGWLADHDAAVRREAAVEALEQAAFATWEPSHAGGHRWLWLRAEALRAGAR